MTGRIIPVFKYLHRPRDSLKLLMSHFITDPHLQEDNTQSLLPGKLGLTILLCFCPLSLQCPVVCESASHASISRENNPLTGPGMCCFLFFFKQKKSKVSPLLQHKVPYTIEDNYKSSPRGDRCEEIQGQGIVTPAVWKPCDCLPILPSFLPPFLPLFLHISTSPHWPRRCCHAVIVI